MKWKVVFSQIFTGKVGEKERVFKLPTLRFKTFPLLKIVLKKNILEFERGHFETQRDRKSFKLTEISLKYLPGF